jgi:hypothetical protein
MLKMYSLMMAFIIGICASAWAQYGSLPAGYAPPSGWENTEWQDPGNWTTLDVTQNGLPANDVSVDAAQKIRDILAANSGNLILFFPSGTYYFATDLAISNSNVRIKGNGNLNTTFRITAPSTANAQIGFAGSSPGPEINVTNLPMRGDQTLTISNASSTLAVGDMIRIYNKGGGFVYNFYNDCQIVKVIAISGDNVTVDFKFGINFNANPKIEKLTMVQNVGFEGFKVIRDNKPNLDYMDNVDLKYVWNGYINAVESQQSPRGHFGVTTSRNVVVENCSYYGSFDYAGGGQAYGVNLDLGSTRVRVTNNKGWDQRHHVMINLGVNHCVISYNSTESNYFNTQPGGGALADVCLHGFGPHNNLIEGNYVNLLGSDGRSEPNGNSSSGRYNAFVRNRITNKYFIDLPSAAGNIGPTNYMVIGNCTQTTPGTLRGTNHVQGNNYRIKLNQVVLGNYTETSDVPSSFYLSGKPLFLSGLSFPVFGPGATPAISTNTYGRNNTIPARARGRTGALPTINTATLCTNCREAATEEPLTYHPPLLYPNPASVEATLVVEAQTVQQTEFVFLDATGRRVEGYLRTLHEGRNAVTLPASTLQPGLYLIQANIDGQAIQARVLIAN